MGAPRDRVPKLRQRLPCLPSFDADFFNCRLSFSQARVAFVACRQVSFTFHLSSQDCFGTLQSDLVTEQGLAFFSHARIASTSAFALDG